ncbi:hypothetical protein [Rhizobium sp. YTU87027]|uniref:hypothetical protein n=1 Tax=Rhizobium sp. YTU87027 TaxID=3417741 RepID=UPI003D684C0E
MAVFAGCLRYRALPFQPFSALTLGEHEAILIANAVGKLATSDDGHQRVQVPFVWRTAG